MKKALLLLAILVVSTITLSVLALYTVMQTSYAAKLVTTFINTLTPYQLETTHAEYSPPFQLTLSDVELQHDDNAIQLPKLTLWLSQFPWQQGKLNFDSILVEGASLDLNELESTLFEQVKLHQLAFKHVDINAGRWSARGVNLQIENPVWQSAQQSLPYGDIQLSAEQLYIQGEALDNLLVDMHYQATDSTVFGSSFNWRGANISGQAEQYPQGWSLVNVTIDQLTLPQSTQIERLVTTLRNLSLPIYYINSLDIINSSFNYRHWRFEHLDASLENLALERSSWQQQAGYASFDAESISNRELQLFSPGAKLAFSHNQIQIEEFDADFKQGRVQLQGVVSPLAVKLSQLTVSGIRWLEQTEQLTPSLKAAVSSLNHLTIDQLDIENAQFIQVEKQPYWQISGLNVEGTNLLLIDQDKHGLLEGKLEISANAASIDKLVSSQAHLTAHASNRKLTLDRAFIPLEQGYIEANGTWDRGSLSAPWQLTLHADGIPLEHYFVEQSLPFSLTGLAETEVELKGLSGDYSMLSHSLSGKVTTYFHQATLQAKSSDGAQEYQHQLDLGAVEMTADRGRITVSSPNSISQIAGEMDLTKPQFSTLLFKSQHDCAELWSDILSATNVIKQTCKPDKPQPITPSPELEIHSSATESSPSTDL
ncbi:AsmA family protein [Vibrio bivalvicida]|uniref:Membrane assembly protein AsmA n=1 Tax=Vibrio bivalvicida TaxID=1276888 RepID=A0A177Y644_9VIBR|nr:AsmA family protein [Vibrio bivalvicida]OAJ96076.1 membrane assembly protein AsmA [Vibrio bivalvicida]